MSKFDIKQYENEITFNKPIKYTSIQLQREITSLLNKIKEEKDNEQKILMWNQINELQNKTLSIRPVLMKDYFLFYSVISCLLVDKNKINDIKIIKMSYLDYLFYSIENDDSNMYAIMFTSLLKLCCDIEEQDIRYIKDKKNHVKLILNGIVYDKKDFDTIKQIICLQNMPDYDDSYIDPDVEAMMKETEELQSKNKKPPSLEKQIISVVISSNLKFEDIDNITIRKFVLILKQVDAKLHYMIYKTGEINGMIQTGKNIFSKEIPHWIYGGENDKFEGKFGKYGDFKKKIESAN